MLPTNTEEIFADMKVAEKFREYVARRRSPEVILFRESVEAYRASSSEASRTIQASKILHAFIQSETAVHEINLPDDVKSKLLSTKEWTRDSFEEAFEINEKLIHWNFFDGFMKEMSSA